MNEEVKCLEQKYENVVFLGTNELALSFKANYYPPQLEETIGRSQFISIIGHVNQIIEKEYIEYKSASVHHLSQSLLPQIFLILIIFAAFILLVSPKKGSSRST